MPLPAVVGKYSKTKVDLDMIHDSGTVIEMVSLGTVFFGWLWRTRLRSSLTERSSPKPQPIPNPKGFFFNRARFSGFLCIRIVRPNPLRYATTLSNLQPNPQPHKIWLVPNGPTPSWVRLRFCLKTQPQPPTDL